MSILIKGMKMPDCCWNCPCLDGEYGECNISGKSIRSDKGRLADCPLIELRNVANECYRGDALYDAGIDAVLKRSEASPCDNCDQRSDIGCSWCRRMERGEDE